MGNTNNHSKMKQKNYFIVPPKLLYCVIPLSNLEEVLLTGVYPEKDKKIHLFTDIETTYKIIQSTQENSIILGVKTLEMYRDKCRIYRYKSNIWLTSNIESKYFKRLSLVETNPDKFHMEYRERYLDYPSKHVMFRMAFYSRKIFCKFYGQEEKEIFMHKRNKLFIEVIAHGYEITQNEYRESKQFSLKSIIKDQNE